MRKITAVTVTYEDGGRETFQAHSGLGVLDLCPTEVLDASRVPGRGTRADHLTIRMPISKSDATKQGS